MDMHFAEIRTLMGWEKESDLFIKVHGLRFLARFPDASDQPRIERFLLDALNSSGDPPARIDRVSRLAIEALTALLPINEERSMELANELLEKWVTKDSITYRNLGSRFAPLEWLRQFPDNYEREDVLLAVLADRLGQRAMPSILKVREWKRSVDAEKMKRDIAEMGWFARFIGEQFGPWWNRENHRPAPDSAAIQLFVERRTTSHWRPDGSLYSDLVKRFGGADAFGRMRGACPSSLVFSEELEDLWRMSSRLSMKA